MSFVFDREEFETRLFDSATTSELPMYTLSYHKRMLDPEMDGTFNFKVEIMQNEFTISIVNGYHYIVPTEYTARIAYSDNIKHRVMNAISLMNEKSLNIVLRANNVIDVRRCFTNYERVTLDLYNLKLSGIITTPRGPKQVKVSLTELVEIFENMKAMSGVN